MKSPNLDIRIWMPNRTFKYLFVYKRAHYYLSKSINYTTNLFSKTRWKNHRVQRSMLSRIRTRGRDISNAGREKLDFAEIDQCKPVLLGISNCCGIYIGNQTMVTSIFLRRTPSSSLLVLDTTIANWTIADWCNWGTKWLLGRGLHYFAIVIIGSNSPSAPHELCSTSLLVFLLSG